MKEMIMQYVVAPAIPVLIGAIGWVFVQLAGWLRAKKGESKTANVLAVGSELVASVVAKIEAEERAAYGKALEDGVLTPEEAAELRDLALKTVKDAAPEAFKTLAKEVFGSLGVDEWLKGLIERAHSALPSTGGGSPQ